MYPQYYPWRNLPKRATCWTVGSHELTSPSSRSEQAARQPPPTVFDTPGLARDSQSFQPTAPALTRGQEGEGLCVLPPHDGAREVVGAVVRLVVPPNKGQMRDRTMLCRLCTQLVLQSPPPPTKAAVGEGSSTASMGCPLGRTWPTARAVALLCVDPTQSSESGTVQRLCWHSLPRERKGV